METYRDFAKTLQSFFLTNLVKERGVSSNTIRAYRDTFVHLLNFIQETKKQLLRRFAYLSLIGSWSFIFLIGLKKRETKALQLEINVLLF